MKKFIKAKREYKAKRCDECNKMQVPVIQRGYIHPVVFVYINRGNMRIRICASCAEKFGEVLKSGFDPSTKKENTKEEVVKEDLDSTRKAEPEIRPDALPVSKGPESAESGTSAPEPETSDTEPDGVRNTFGVFAYQPGADRKEGIMIGRALDMSNFISREDALNLAAWLAVYADPTQKDFPTLLKKIVDMGNE